MDERCSRTNCFAQHRHSSFTNSFGCQSWFWFRVTLTGPFGLFSLFQKGWPWGWGGAQNNTKPSFTCLEQCWTLREIHNLLLIMFSMVKSISISPNFCLSISFYALKPIHWLEVLTVGGRITVDSKGKQETHITRCNWMKLPFQTLRKYKLRRTVRGGGDFTQKS